MSDYAVSNETIWREVQGGWAANFGDGLSAIVQVTRKGEVRWNVALTGLCDTIAEARQQIEFFHNLLTEESPT